MIATSESFFEGGSHIIQPIGLGSSISEVKLKVLKEKFTPEIIELKILLGAG